MTKKPTANRRLARLRILSKIHVHVSQEILSLTENKQFLTLQLTRSGGTLAVMLAKHYE